MSDFKKLKEFIELAKSEGVAELEYESKDQKFSVSFLSGNVSHQVATVTHQSTAEAKATPVGKNRNDSFHEIKSPFVGTYYAAPAPDKPNFVSVGDRVNSGQTLCILEAMKIMNEIESDISGEVVEVCVENESLVEFGQTLFRIKA